MIASRFNDLATLAGVQWFDYQLDALHAAESQQGQQAQRMCLYYKTGAGKSITALGTLALWGHGAAVVIAPPSTHPQWAAAAAKFGIDVECMSHAKFRMKGTKLSRFLPVIADEFHLFGGHGGQGWKKLDGLAKGLQAPMILASATPNYNDAERVYCIQHILDPHGTKGGYLEFLYAHCTTEQNPFGMEPIVTGFHRYTDAAEFLAALPGVQYLPDDLVYQIVDIPIPFMTPVEFHTYGLNERAGRIIASQIEERHAVVNLSLVADHGGVWPHIVDELTHLVGNASTPVLVFAAHSTVAKELVFSLSQFRASVGLVTGDTVPTKKARLIADFNAGRIDVLVGTASLATGTDGMDKVCDTLIILDDTDDDALRRQLIGRIMPRGQDTDASKKRVYRLVLQ